MSRLLALLVVLVLAPSVRAQEAPPGTDLELAKAHFNTGQIYYERKRFPDAAREFEEAYRLSGRPDLLFNMGKAYDGAGDHARALAAWRSWLEAVPAGSPTKEDAAGGRAEVLDRVAQLEHLVGRLSITANLDGASVDLDGVRVGLTPLQHALELNPGAHHVEVAKEGFRTFRRDVVATPGGALTVDAQLASLLQVKVIEVEKKERPQPVYKKWWLWTLVGAVVAAGAITGGVLGAREPPLPGDSAQLPAVR